MNSKGTQPFIYICIYYSNISNRSFVARRDSKMLPNCQVRDPFRGLKKTECPQIPSLLSLRGGTGGVTFAWDWCSHLPPNPTSTPWGLCLFLAEQELTLGKELGWWAVSLLRAISPFFLANRLTPWRQSLPSRQPQGKWVASPSSGEYLEEPMHLF